MADPTPTTTTPAHDDPHGIRKDVDSPGQLILVFLAVVGMALLNIFASMSIGPKPFVLPMQLAIGTLQAGLVGYYFMHLKQGDRVVILTALSSLFWMGILFVLFLADYLSRSHVVTG
jgi:cytochrome c oxidase subunit 4